MAPSDLVPAIKAVGLTKNFGRTRALDGLDLVVAQGEAHGFLGPNGAGKSTTIRALLGQLRLSSGTAQLFGLDCARDSVAAHRRVAYVPGDVALWPGLTGGECIDILARSQGRPNENRRTELIERFDLDPTKRTRTYSKGNRQKVALCAALSTDADLLLLDEPTSGLDPLMEKVFQDYIREAKENGTTVLLSSHILAEVEALCDRVSIVRLGRVVTEGSLAELRVHTLTHVSAVTRLPIPGLDQFAGLSELTVAEAAGQVRTSFQTTPEALGRSVALVASCDPTALTVEPPSLDQLFLARYEAASS
jgi:ABC-2 type transport system ATP-binding protein